MAQVAKFIKRRRFCKVASCKRLLSMYNFSPYCYVHQQLAATEGIGYSDVTSKPKRRSGSSRNIGVSV